MSILSQDPSYHDIYVGLACRRLCLDFPNNRVVAVDGATPFEDCLADFPKTFFGYRPDAILREGDTVNHWLVEVKSANDLKTSHTLKQFLTIRKILNENPEWRIFILVFNCFDPEDSILHITRHLGRERVVIQIVKGVVQND